MLNKCTKKTITSLACLWFDWISNSAKAKTKNLSNIYKHQFLLCDRDIDLINENFEVGTNFLQKALVIFFLCFR